MLRQGKHVSSYFKSCEKQRPREIVPITTARHCMKKKLGVVSCHRGTNQPRRKCTEWLLEIKALHEEQAGSSFMLTWNLSAKEEVHRRRDCWKGPALVQFYELKIRKYGSNARCSLCINQLFYRRDSGKRRKDYKLISSSKTISNI